MRRTKFISILLAVLAIGGLIRFWGSNPGFADEDREIKVWINDFYIMSDVPPFVKNETTYVPIRFVAEELGYDVQWYPDTNEISISNDEKTIFLQIGSRYAYVEGRMIDLMEELGGKEGRTFLPVRRITEVLDEKIEYEPITKTAVIGDHFQYDEFYHVKYYYDTENVYITKDRFNLYSYIVIKDGQYMQEFDSEAELMGYADDNVERFFQENIDKYNKDSRVAANKQMFDSEYYVAPDPDDPFVGSWFGMTKTRGTSEYYDDYNFIRKAGYNDYEVTSISVKPNGSELHTRQRGYYDEYEGMFMMDESYETFYASGDFDYEWFRTGGGMTLVGNSYFSTSDPKIYLQKYWSVADHYDPESEKRSEEGSEMHEAVVENGEIIRKASNTFPQFSVRTQDGPYTVKFHDDLFRDSSMIYDNDIALLSAVLSLAAETEDGNLIVDAYRKLGFAENNIHLYSYPKNEKNRSDYTFAKDDALAFSIAHKDTDYGKLFIVTLRGSTVGGDWYKNFSGVFEQEEYLGKIVHSGFKYFAIDVKNALKNLLNELGVAEQCKILITGHSLGGAGANLAAVWLSRGEISQFAADDVFAYTFAAPNTCRNIKDMPYDEYYDNLFNIIHRRDMVPFIPVTTMDEKKRDPSAPLWHKFGRYKLFGFSSKPSIDMEGTLLTFSTDPLDFQAWNVIQKLRQKNINVEEEHAMSLYIKAIQSGVFDNSREYYHKID